ncbi:putative RNA recognition motif domain, RNA-binding domain superfamily [Helianthus anomalus]
MLLILCQWLIMKCFRCKVFIYGSVPLKTYLPDGDIDLTTLSDHQNLKDSWATEVCDLLQTKEKIENATFQVKELTRSPLGYAFVDFDDRRDALDAIRDLDVYRNQCPLVEKPIKTSLKSQKGSFKNFFNRLKGDGEKVDDHSWYYAGSGNDICRVWACCQACPS